LENSQKTNTKPSDRRNHKTGSPWLAGWMGAVSWKALWVIHILMVLTLTGLFVIYRTHWIEIELSQNYFWVLVSVVLLSTWFTALLYLWVGKYCRRFKAMELNLEKIVGIEGAQQIFDAIEPFPVSSRMSGFAQGWNKLVSTIDQVRSEQQLQQAESSMGNFLCSYDAQRLLGLLDSLPDGIVLADAAGTVILANRACEGKISKRLGEFIGRSLEDLFDDPNSKQIINELLDQTHNPSDAGFEVVIPLGQSGRPEHSENSPARQTTDSQLGPDQLLQTGATILWIYCQRLTHDRDNSDILLTIRDITQRKVSEAGQEAFIAHVSHEMRSPLTNIRAYAETLLSDMVLDAGTQKEAFNVINEETSRLIRLVNDVLDLSNMETGTLSLDKGEVVLDRLVRQCVNDVRAAAGSKKITLQSNFHPKLPKLSADREKLAVVINNLLSNAIKYTPNNGTVFVETNIDDRYVYIKVTDTGIGIAEEDREKVFEKFYRIEREETADEPGSGLGLATAREIATLHGGTINMTSELNKGTEMELKLPVTMTGPVLGPAADNNSQSSAQ